MTNEDHGGDPQMGATETLQSNERDGKRADRLRAMAETEGESNSMAFPTSVNNQITDAVTQANVTALASAPASAAGNLAQMAAQAFGLMMENAVAQQQNAAMCAQAAANQGVIQINGAGAAAASKLAQSDVPDNLLSLLSALRAGTAPLPS
jgi:hypothetical protein